MIFVMIMFQHNLNIYDFLLLFKRNILNTYTY